MNVEDFRVQVRQMLARNRSAEPGSEVGTGVCVPLRLKCAADISALTELVQRVAASPALAAANAAGLLRFELSIDPAAAATVAAAGSTCCDDCSRGEACRCGHASTAATPAVTPLLRGVVTEREIKSLPANCKLVGTAPRVILTPLAREALRQRGIAVQPAKGD